MNEFGPNEQKIAAFLSGLGQKCIVAAVKKWKEGLDKRKLEAEAAAVQEHALAKAISTKIEQRITASLRSSHLTDEQFQRLLEIDTNPVLKEELVSQFLADTISAESVVSLFLGQVPALGALHDDLVPLATAWLEAIDKAVAEDALLCRVMNFRSHRAIRSDLSSLGDQLARAELRDSESERRDQQRHEEVLLAFHSLSKNLLNSSDGSLSNPKDLQDQNQRRFERARNQIITGSVVAAEKELRELVEDFDALGAAAPRDLLFKHSVISNCRC